VVYEEIGPAAALGLIFFVLVLAIKGALSAECVASLKSIYERQKEQTGTKSGKSPCCVEIDPYW